MKKKKSVAIREWEGVEVVNFPRQGVRFEEEEKLFGLYQYGNTLFFVRHELLHAYRYTVNIKEIPAGIVKVLNSDEKLPHLLSELRTIVKDFFTKSDLSPEEVKGLFVFEPSQKKTFFLYQTRSVRWRDHEGRIWIENEVLKPTGKCPNMMEEIARTPLPKAGIGEEFKIFICDQPCELVVIEDYLDKEE